MGRLGKDKRLPVTGVTGGRSWSAWGSSALMLSVFMFSSSVVLADDPCSDTDVQAGYIASALQQYKHLASSKGAFTVHQMGEFGEGMMGQPRFLVSFVNGGTTLFTHVIDYPPSSVADAFFVHPEAGRKAASLRFGYGMGAGGRLSCEYLLSTGPRGFVVRRVAASAAGPVPTSSNNVGRPRASDGPTDPPMPYIDFSPQADLLVGVWRLRQAHEVYAAISPTPKSIGRIKAGVQVQATRIGVLTLGTERFVVQRPMNYEVWNWNGSAALVTTYVPLQPGDKVTVLSYYGEGECRVWIGGSAFTAFCPEERGGGVFAKDKGSGKLATELWAEIAPQRGGAPAYLRNPDADGMSEHE